MVSLVLCLLSPASAAEPVVLGDVHPTVSLGQDVIVQRGAVVQEGAVLEQGAYIGRRAFVGENTTIGARTVVGTRSTVEQDVRIAPDSVVGRASFVGAHSDYRQSLITGYATTLGRGIDADTLVAGSLARLGGDPGDDVLTIHIHHLLIARGSWTSVQWPFTLNNPDSGLTEPVVVGPDTHIEPGVTLHPGVRVRKNAHIGQRAVLDPGTRVGRDTCVGDSAVIGEDARLAARVTTGQDTMLTADTTVRRGTEVGEGASACGVWPEGEPGPFVGYSATGFPLHEPMGEGDPDPGSNPPLWTGED